MPSEKITLSNINQFMGLAKKEPALLNIGSMFIFRPYLTIVDAAGCTKCTDKKAKLAALRPQFEAALMVLTDSEKARMKTILDTKRVCFWNKTPNGQLAQHCF